MLKYTLILFAVFVGITILPAYASIEFTPFQNISNSPSDSIGPFVVTDGKNIFIAWSEFSNANHSSDIHFSKSSDGGKTFSTPQNISNQQGSSIVPFIHVEGSTIFITWTYKYQDDHYSEIYFSKSTDGGVTFNTPQKISGATFSYSSKLVTADKNIFVTWSDTTYSNERHYENMEVFFSKSTDGGATFSTPMNLSNNKEFSSHSSIVTVGKDIFISWQDQPNGITDIFISKSTDGGVTFSTPKNISNSLDSSVGAKLTTDGTNIFVTWFEFHKSIGDIFFSKSTDGGTTFSTPINLSKNKENSLVPFMTTDGNDIFITWTDSTTTGSWIVFSKSTDGGITFSAPQKISNENGFSDAPSIATDGKIVFTAWNYRLKLESQYDILFSKSIIDESLINKESQDKTLPLDESKKVNDANLKDDSEYEIQNYTIGTIEWVDSKPFLGGYGVVRIVDPDMNKNPELVDIFKAKTWSVTDTKGIELDMIETNSDTGIFYIDIEFSSKKSAIQILETSLGDIITVSYIDSTTPDGQYVELTDTITISQPPPSHKQLELGILPENIKCKDDMELVFKHTDGSPACVTVTTKNILIERGWVKEIDLSFCNDWCDKEELLEMGCTESLLDYLHKNSDFFDDVGFYSYGFGGPDVPNGVTEEKYEECADFVYEKRATSNSKILELYKNTPEVIAFYEKYPDIQEEVVSDHISYIARSADGYEFRMNLNFDKNHDVTDLNFHCSVQREHQWEHQWELDPQDILGHLLDSEIMQKIHC